MVCTWIKKKFKKQCNTFFDSCIVLLLCGYVLQILGIHSVVILVTRADQSLRLVLRTRLRINLWGWFCGPGSGSIFEAGSADQALDQSLRLVLRTRLWIIRSMLAILFSIPRISNFTCKKYTKWKCNIMWAQNILISQCEISVFIFKKIVCCQ